MKSIEINDLLSYHFYGNLKVKDGVKVFVDGVAAEKENAYEYTLKCVKNDKVYDLTSYGKESGFYIENENSILFCGNRKNIEKSTSLYRLSLNGGEAKEIARFDKPGMSVLGYLNEKTLVLLTKEKLVEEESDYEVFDEIPFYMNGQESQINTVVIYIHIIWIQKNLFVLQKALLMYQTQRFMMELCIIQVKIGRENNLYMKIFISMMVK